jgi:hypothetical protein
MLNDIGSASTQLAVWTMWNPKVALVPLTIGGLSYMANNLLCQDMPFPDWPENPGAHIDGCSKLNAGGGGKILYKPCENESDPLAYCAFAPETNVNEILGVSTAVIPNNPNLEYTVRFRLTTGQERSASQILSPGTTVYIFPFGDATCERDGPGLQPTPDFEPYPYTDPETNCNYTLKLEGFVQQYENGPAEPVWNIRSADSARADGGRMGACNLAPTIYIGGDGSGGDGIKPPQFPVPPLVPPDGPDGVPWWLPPLVGATTGALLNQLGRLMNDTFNYPMEPGGFDLVAPCDFDAEGANELRQWAFPKTPLILRLHDHQVAMMEIMQQHLNWKTPTCNDNAKPPLEGEWVTTRWQSVETMPHSGHRLRKQFRYRSKSGLSLAQRSAYWEWFQWRSGDVIVRHEGAWWGNPQVWAEDEEEGKRVIRFAAGEAGLDPDQTGEWKVSSSSSPRYGMSGTMKIQLYKGFPWISSRGGASYPNTLAKVHHP